MRRLAWAVILLILVAASLLPTEIWSLFHSKTLEVARVQAHEIQRESMKEKDLQIRQLKSELESAHQLLLDHGIEHSFATDLTREEAKELLPRISATARTTTRATTTTTTWTTTTTSRRKPMYSDSDAQLLKPPSTTLPRVLIYTWCTEDTFDKFVNEVYWKCCYAHAHGFDVVFSDKIDRNNFTGMAEWNASMNGKFDKWYSEENMFALWPDLERYLFSGQYDYVFMMGADVLIREAWLDWPVWAWNAGHDVTIMDQHRFAGLCSYGLNENDVLFRPSEFSKWFIHEVFEYRKGFYLQGDNGPYMETIITALGREAEEKFLKGYDKGCLKYLKLDRPSVMLFNDSRWVTLNDQYDDCFFEVVDRVAGGYGFRISKNLGFYPTFIGTDGRALLPADFTGSNPPPVPPDHMHAGKVPLGPWANCWSCVRETWANPWANCFAFHWNGPKDPKMVGQIQGTCPDPTFDWEASVYNPVNRKGYRLFTGRNPPSP